MKYAVNYINEEVLKLSTPNDVYIKYPGGKWDLETLSNLNKENFKIVLHGVIPSSGSILDPNLLNGFETFSKYIKETNQEWLSFHFDYKDKYNAPDYIKTLENNLKIIRSKFPNLPILIENLPPVDNIKGWCSDPKLLNSIMEKYNLKFLLDVPHALISAEHLGISFEEYVNQLNLDNVVEIHFSGLGKTKAGKLYDGHICAEDKHYDCLKYVLGKCHNLKMLSLEYAPTRDYDGETVAKDYISSRNAIDLYNEQQMQLKKVKQLYKSIAGTKDIMDADCGKQ